jgi:hypothetical protein
LLMFVTFRDSLPYWALLSILVLPVVAWKGRALWWWCLAFAGVGFGLAASPIDFTVQSGPVAVRVLPVMFGITCQEGFACYGCIVPPHPPSHAVVLSF